MRKYKIFTKNSYSHLAESRLLFITEEPDKELEILRSKHNGVIFYSIPVESFYEKYKLPITIGLMVTMGNLFIVLTSKIGLFFK